MSIIPQRPHDAPSMAFYSLGNFDKSVTVPRHIQPVAAPGYAAKIAQRNIHHTEENKLAKEINGKAQSKRYYDPRTHLNPLNVIKHMDKDRHIINANNQAMNRVSKMKQYCQTFKASEVNEGGLIKTTNDFNTKKQVSSVPASRRSDVSHSHNFNQTSKPSKVLGQNYFYITKRISTNSASTGNNFGDKNQSDARAMSKDAPQWFKVTEKPEHQKTVKDAPGYDGTMTILSRNAGWITVTPKRQDRKKPIEKFGMGGDASKTSKLTPAWMQTVFEKPKYNSMKAGLPGQNVRGEKNRTFLVDKRPPSKNVLTYGHTRHNIQTTQGAQKGNQGAKVPRSSGFYRIYEWKGDNPERQNFDKPLTHKIGSRHD